MGGRAPNLLTAGGRKRGRGKGLNEREEVKNSLAVEKRHGKKKQVQYRPKKITVDKRKKKI